MLGHAYRSQIVSHGDHGQIQYNLAEHNRSSVSISAESIAVEAKAEAAKKRARDGFGEGDGDWMDSDPDRPRSQHIHLAECLLCFQGFPVDHADYRSEQSSEEQMESYFDLVKRYTTKKTLPTANLACFPSYW